jgi:putative membrane protein
MSKNPDQEPDKTDLAATRTELAEDRTIMAMERTFAGWIRTAFAAIGIGIGFNALFGEFDPPWLARAIATLFVVAGAGLAWSAQSRACRTLSRLHPHELEQPSAPNFRLLSFAVIIGAALLVAGLWILNDDAVLKS